MARVEQSRAEQSVVRSFDLIQRRSTPLADGTHSPVVDFLRSHNVTPISGATLLYRLRYRYRLRADLTCVVLFSFFNFFKAGLDLICTRRILTLVQQVSARWLPQLCEIPCLVEA